MTKRRIYHIVEWGIALAGCGFLAWKMATYEDYAALGDSLQSMDWKAYTALVLALALMPLNMSLEAWRWKTLLPMSWHDAHIQVYYSKLAGLITPWKLGEYPARAVQRGEWKQTLSMGAVGSATMTTVIIIFGVAAMMITDFRFEILDLRFSYLITLAIILVLLGVALWFAPRLLRRWANVSHRLVMVSLGQSLVRLVCWCVQLALVIWALGGIEVLDVLDVLEVLGLTMVYYLFVTVTPNVPIAEVGVRGAWAIVVFGTMNAAMAGVILWGINTLLPCLIWPFLRKITK